MTIDIHFKVIAEVSRRLLLLPRVWHWNFQYLVQRLPNRFIAIGFRTINFPHARWTFSRLHVYQQRHHCCNKRRLFNEIMDFHIMSTIFSLALSQESLSRGSWHFGRISVPCLLLQQCIYLVCLIYADIYRKWIDGRRIIRIRIIMLNVIWMLIYLIYFYTVYELMPLLVKFCSYKSGSRHFPTRVLRSYATVPYVKIKYFCKVLHVQTRAWSSFLMLTFQDCAGAMHVVILKVIRKMLCIGLN